MDPKQRIGNRDGFQELKEHPFFTNAKIDWEKEIDFTQVFPLQIYQEEISNQESLEASPMGANYDQLSEHQETQRKIEETKTAPA